MRNYVRKKQNPAYLPHEMYMQMLYLIRDYQVNGQGKDSKTATLRAHQWQIATEVFREQEQLYAKGDETRKSLNALQAFFDYPYYSLMYTQKSRGAGACKRSWALYRSRLAYAIAEKLDLI